MLTKEEEIYVENKLTFLNSVSNAKIDKVKEFLDNDNFLTDDIYNLSFKLACMQFNRTPELLKLLLNHHRFNSNEYKILCFRFLKDSNDINCLIYLLSFKNIDIVDLSNKLVAIAITNNFDIELISALSQHEKLDLTVDDNKLLLKSIYYRREPALEILLTNKKIVESLTVDFFNSTISRLEDKKLVNYVKIAMRKNKIDKIKTT